MLQLSLLARVFLGLRNEQVMFLPAIVTVQPEASLSLPPLINIKSLTLTQQHQQEG